MPILKSICERLLLQLDFWYYDFNYNLQQLAMEPLPSTKQPQAAIK